MSYHPLSIKTANMHATSTYASLTIVKLLHCHDFPLSKGRVCLETQVFLSLFPLQVAHGIRGPPATAGYRFEFLGVQGFHGALGAGA